MKAKKVLFNCVLLWSSLAVAHPNVIYHETQLNFPAKHDNIDIQVVSHLGWLEDGKCSYVVEKTWSHIIEGSSAVRSTLGYYSSNLDEAAIGYQDRGPLQCQKLIFLIDGSSLVLEDEFRLTLDADNHYVSSAPERTELQVVL